jgi:hypothetical protein
MRLKPMTLRSDIEAGVRAPASYTVQAAVDDRPAPSGYLDDPRRLKGAVEDRWVSKRHHLDRHA